jgi:hypothetical protein
MEFAATMSAICALHMLRCTEVSPQIGAMGQARQFEPTSAVHPIADITLRRDGESRRLPREKRLKLLPMSEQPPQQGVFILPSQGRHHV